ncbi:MAG: alpha/beta hydrolase-fold protein [Patulibacter minatonensis]
MRVRPTAALLATLVALPLAVAPPTQAAGCGFLNAQACPKPPVSDPAARTPGAPVAPVTQVNKSTNTPKNTIRGTVKPTKVFGTLDPGVVPLVGAVGAKADDGSYVMYESRVDERTVDLMVWSAGLQGPAPVRLQLPPSWGTDPARKYPALWLLHGGNDQADYQCWSVYSQFTQRVGQLDALIVMPSAGVGGHTTDYWNYGSNSGKQYGTFVGTELQQILRRGYKLGDKAAVAGASSGARSALEVAFKNPGRFGAAAAYSGLLDTQLPGVEQSITLGPLAVFQLPYEMWGSPLLNRSIWNDRNPAKNLEKLRGIDLYVSTVEGSLPTGYIDPLEPVVNYSTRSFLNAAQRAGLPVTAELYREGIHAWPNFDAAFGRSLPMLAGALGLTAQPQPADLPVGAA